MNASNWTTKFSGSRDEWMSADSSGMRVVYDNLGSSAAELGNQGWTQ
jgi:hypothetical protein